MVKLRLDVFVCLMYSLHGFDKNVDGNYENSNLAFIRKASAIRQFFHCKIIFT